MSKTVFTEDTFDPRVDQSSELNSQTIIDIENLNIRITNSYLFKKAADLEAILDYIMSKDAYQKLAAAGYTRTKKSLLREWKAHNVLYRWGYEKERTGSVDMNQHESRSRRIGYFFLSLFF